MEVLEYLEEVKKEIEKIIKKYFPQKIEPHWLDFAFGKPKYAFSKKAFQEVLNKPIWDFLDRGGKRWRPALFLLILEAVGGDIKKLKEFALVPELVHQGTLICDDIEDEGELRRGKPCLHKIFGVDVALNAGNFLYFFPLIVFLKNRKKIKKEVLNRVFEIYIKEMINLHLGQGTDIFWHKGKETKISKKEYLQMCAFKTGCIPRMLAKMAVILAGKSEKLAEKFGAFAEALGIAFQIQDDILDIELSGQEREKFGKSFGNDIKEGKRSLMVIYTLQKASKKDRERLIKILNLHTDSLKLKKEAIAILKKYKSIEYAKNVAKKILENAWQKIEKEIKKKEIKEKLMAFSEFLIKRKL